MLALCGKKKKGARRRRGDLWKNVVRLAFPLKLWPQCLSFAAERRPAARKI